MLIKEFMTSNPITVGEEVTVIEAAELMKRNKVRRFPVLRNNELIGIVSDRDIRSAGPSQVISFDEYERELFPDLYDLLAKIKDIMSRHVVTISPEKTILTAAILMLKHHISGIPVVDTQGKLLGLITEEEIFKALVDFSGSHLGKTLFGLNLDDRPGAAKEVADVIMEHGGRVASFLNAYLKEDLELRRVYVRMMDQPAIDMDALKEDLQKKFELLFMIRDDVDIS